MPEGPQGAIAHRVLAEAAMLRSGRRDPTPAQTPEADIRTGPWWCVRTLRRSAARAAISVGGLVALAFITLNAYPWWADAVALTAGPTAKAQATVRHVDRVLVPVLFPENLQVSFRAADGRTVRTHLARRGEAPAQGETLTVEYAVAHPHHAAAANSHGLLWSVADSLVLAALCLARIGWCAVSAARTTRALVSAARSPEAHPARYVRFHDEDEDRTWLLFFPMPGHGTDPPAFLLPLRGGTCPPAGPADLRGDVRDGGIVVPWIGGRAMWPSCPLTAFRPDDEGLVLRLASGALDTGDTGGRRTPLA